MYGLDNKNQSLSVLDSAGILTSVELDRGYSKIIYNPANQTFLTGCPYPSTTLYILDENFREIDTLQISLDNSCFQTDDICFDMNFNIIWVLTSHDIKKFNYNSDFLGSFMNAPKGTTYKAICIYHQFIFLAYEKSDCLYIASYTSQGAYLERINLGCDYSIRNLQVINNFGYPVLRAYVIKSYRFPYMIEIELNCEKEKFHNHRQSSGIEIECMSSDPGIRASCHVQE